MDVLHAWKDHMWKIGGEVSSPGPRVLCCGMNAEVDDDDGDGGDDDGEWIDEEVEAAAVVQLETLTNEDTQKVLSQEGAYLRRKNEPVAESSQRSLMPYGKPSLNQFQPRYRSCR